MRWEGFDVGNRRPPSSVPSRFTLYTSDFTRAEKRLAASLRAGVVAFLPYHAIGPKRKIAGGFGGRAPNGVREASCAKRKAEGIRDEPAYCPTVSHRHPVIPSHRHTDSVAFRLSQNALHSSFSVLSVPSVVQESPKPRFWAKNGLWVS